MAYNYHSPSQVLEMWLAEYMQTASASQTFELQDGHVLHQQDMIEEALNLPEDEQTAWLEANCSGEVVGLTVAFADQQEVVREGSEGMLQVGEMLRVKVTCKNRAGAAATLKSDVQISVVLVELDKHDGQRKHEISLKNETLLAKHSTHELHILALPAKLDAQFMLQMLTADKLGGMPPARLIDGAAHRCLRCIHIPLTDRIGETPPFTYKQERQITEGGDLEVNAAWCSEWHHANFGIEIRKKRAATTRLGGTGAQANVYSHLDNPHAVIRELLHFPMSDQERREFFKVKGPRRKACACPRLLAAEQAHAHM